MCWGRLCCREKVLSSRTVWIGRENLQKFPPNVIRNQKYNIFTFIPIVSYKFWMPTSLQEAFYISFPFFFILFQVLFNQFKFFLNLFFLIMALSQFIPQLRIGYLYTYWLPLGCVLAVTMIREAIDDFRRFQRDREVNAKRYDRLTSRGKVSVASSDLKVGDIIYVEKGQRVPADMVLLRTTEQSGACFIRTDQLDGETDWKLR